MNNTRHKYTIVHPSQADPTKGLLSIESPLAKALINHKTGDKIQVETPAGIQTYKIVQKE